MVFGYINPGSTVVPNTFTTFTVTLDSGQGSYTPNIIRLLWNSTVIQNLSVSGIDKTSNTPYSRTFTLPSAGSYSNLKFQWYSNSAGGQTLSTSQAYIITTSLYPPSSLAQASTPTATTVTLTIGDTNNSNGSSSITYQYEVNGSGTWLNASGMTASVTGLLADYANVVNVKTYVAARTQTTTGGSVTQAAVTSATSTATTVQTPPAAPTVSFGSWSSVTTNSATLNMTIDYNSGYTYTYSLNGTTYTAANATSTSLSLVFTNAQLVDGNSYNFTLIARNTTTTLSSVASTAVVVVAPPWTPTAGTATATNTGRLYGDVSVTFTTPNTNANNVYQYVVTDISTNAVFSGPASPPSSSPLVVSGLALARNYSVVVQAYNTQTALTSGSSNAVTFTMPPLPPVVSFVSFNTPTTTTSVTLNLTIDYTSGYTYTYSLNGTTYTAANATSTSLSLVLTNATLVDGTSTNVTLIATNSFPSAASTAVVVVAPPFTPTIASATPNNNGTASVVVSSNNTNANNVYRYVVTDSSTNTVTNGVGSSSPLVLTGLVPTRAYSVVLQAYNTQTVLASGSSNVATFSTYAFPPQITYVRVTSTTTATVSFKNHPNNTSNAVTGYQYSYSTDPFVPAYTSLASTATSFSLTSLSASSVYYLTMTATTALGNSAPSTMVPFSLTKGTPTSRYGGGGGGGATNGTTSVNNGGAGGGGSGGSASGVAGLGGGGGGADGSSTAVIVGGRGGSGQVRVTLGAAAVPTLPSSLTVASITSTSASFSFKGNGNDSLTYSVVATAMMPFPATTGFSLSAATQINKFGLTATGFMRGIAIAYLTTPNRVIFITNLNNLYYASVSGTDTLDADTPLYVITTGKAGYLNSGIAVTPNASRLALTIGSYTYFCDTAASLTTGAASLSFTQAGTTSIAPEYISLSTDGNRMFISANSVLKWADYDTTTGNFGAFTNTLHTGLVNVASISMTGNKQFLCYSTRYITSSTNTIYWSAWNNTSNYAYGTVIASTAVGSGTTGSYVRATFLGQSASVIIAQASLGGLYVSYWAGQGTGYTAFASVTNGSTATGAAVIASDLSGNIAFINSGNPVIHNRYTFAFPGYPSTISTATQSTTPNKAVYDASTVALTSLTSNMLYTVAVTARNNTGTNTAYKSFSTLV